MQDDIVYFIIIITVARQDASTTSRVYILIWYSLSAAMQEVAERFEYFADQIFMITKGENILGANINYRQVEFYIR
jgi:hypothetical protein